MQKAGIPAFFIAHYFPLITFFMATFPWGWLLISGTILLPGRD